MLEFVNKQKIMPQATQVIRFNYKTKITSNHSARRSRCSVWLLFRSSVRSFVHGCLLSCCLLSFCQRPLRIRAVCTLFFFLLHEALVLCILLLLQSNNFNKTLLRISSKALFTLSAKQHLFFISRNVTTSSLFFCFCLFFCVIEQMVEVCHSAN